MGRAIAFQYRLFRWLLDLVDVQRLNQAELQAEVLALRHQVRVLERQIKRVRWTPADRLILAALLGRMPKPAWDGLLVKPETVLGWHRNLVKRKWASYRDRPRRGRPPIAADLRHLIVRMAKENTGWGYTRIKGELKKLGCLVGATAIRSILLRAGVPPAPRRSELTWKQFLMAHAESLVAADYFSVDTVLLKRLYVLLYVHLKTRRIIWAISTDSPNQNWLAQQSRNLLWKLEDQGITMSGLIHDRDGKFSPQGDRVIRSAGSRVILTPIRAPKANAIAERLVGTFRRECLDRMLIVNQRHLEVVLTEYWNHYDLERPHRSCGLRPPAARAAPRPWSGRVHRQTRLGGLLSSYQRLPVGT